MQINVNNPNFVTVESGGVGSTGHSVGLKINLPLQKSQARAYIEDAKKLVDKWKEEGYNAVGINAKLAALIIEVVGNDYTGRPTDSKTVNYEPIGNNVYQAVHGPDGNRE